MICVLVPYMGFSDHHPYTVDSSTTCHQAQQERIPEAREEEALAASAAAFLE